MSASTDRYGPEIAALLADDRLPALGPGSPDLAVRPRLQSLDFGPHRVSDRTMARCCQAGLWLLFDFLDESHKISQDVETPTGSYWHGLMHRREPDASNASYWFRRVGDHPVFEALAREAEALGLRLRSGRWDPFHFIELCEEHRDAGTEQELLLRRVQRKEWDLLFDYCFGRAVSK